MQPPDFLSASPHLSSFIPRSLHFSPVPLQSALLARGRHYLPSTYHICPSPQYRSYDHFRQLNVPMAFLIYNLYLFVENALGHRLHNMTSCARRSLLRLCLYLTRSSSSGNSRCAPSLRKATDLLIRLEAVRYECFADPTNLL